MDDVLIFWAKIVDDDMFVAVKVEIFIVWEEIKPLIIITLEKLEPESKLGCIT